MPVRREISLPVVFFTAAAFLTASAADAQQVRTGSPGTHISLTPSNGGLSGDQVKQALDRFGGSAFAGPGGIPMDLAGLAKLLGKGPDSAQKGIDPKSVEGLLKHLQQNPELMRRIAEEARQQKASGKSTALPADIEAMLKNFPRPPVGEPKGVGGKQLDPPPSVRPPGEGSRPVDPDPKEPQTTATPPDPGMPVVPPNPEDRFPDDTTNPPAPFSPAFDPNETPRDRAMRAAASLWERNVGPLDETPAVKRALLDLAMGTEDLTDSEGNSFWDSLSKETGDATSFADFIDKSALGDSWTMPKFDLPSFGWSQSNSDLGSGEGSRSSSSRDSWWSRRSSPRIGSSPSSRGGFSLPGMEGSWLPVVLLAAVLLGGLIWWRFWYYRDPRTVRPYEIGGLGPWPVDPQRIATRRDVVLAFDYLSVLICGPSAKMWTHSTIAAALEDLATTQGQTAIVLARLYELARYAPLNEPLTTAELAEGRRLICHLAGLRDE